MTRADQAGPAKSLDPSCSARESAGSEGPPGVPAPSALLLQAPAWRREPFRLFFPLGVLLAWAGVGHWFVLAAFGLGEYSSIFHSVAQIQGFMMCFAVGFLFTAIPRRTQTRAPSALEMGIGLGVPVATTIAAWTGRLALSQGLWAVLVVTLVAFALRRFRSRQAGRRPPSSFVWVPLALGFGLLGSGLTGVYGALGAQPAWLHELGKGLLVQGMFLGLVLGVGGLVLPLLTCGDAPPDSPPGARGRREKAAHFAGALLLGLSFWVEAVHDLRLGLLLRCGVTGFVLLRVGRIQRLPRLPGWHRWLVWGSAWLIPVGYALAAAWPVQRQAGLHVVFIGGFALMALGVGMHVTLAHGGHRRLVRARPWQVVALGLLLGAALVTRALMQLDPERIWTWMGAASACFLLGTLVWLAYVLPRLRPAAEEQG